MLFRSVCPQSLAVLQNTSTMSVPGDISISEDCKYYQTILIFPEVNGTQYILNVWVCLHVCVLGLSINVIKPLGVPDGEKLPVLFVRTPDYYDVTLIY